MKVFVGLGNPQSIHTDNRHNVGHKVINALVPFMNLNYKRKPSFSQKFIQNTVFDYNPFALLAKPIKYMNDSGVAVKKLLDSYKVSSTDLYVIHDDLDIKLGEYKIQFGKGPKVHNGVKSVEDEIGTKKFWRIRIGIENRNSKDKTPGDEYVLTDFTEDEKRIINWVITKIIHEKVFEDIRHTY